jgi:hypothetical protein
MQIPYSEKLNNAGLDASEELVRLAKERLADSIEGLETTELWYSADTLSRNDFRWLNMIAVKHQ